MSMSTQVISLSRSITYHLPNISRIHHYLDFETCNHVVHSLVLSRLDYGNILLLGSNFTEIARLKRLQNWAAKIIFPVRERVCYKAMLYVYKCLTGLGPDYLASSLTLYIPGRQRLRSATDATGLHVSKVHYRLFKSAADKAFAFAAPKLWNQLPASVRSSNSLPAFKKGLKTFFFFKLMIFACKLVSILFLLYILSCFERCDHLKWRYIKAYVCMYVCMYVTNCLKYKIV